MVGLVDLPWGECGAPDLAHGVGWPYPLLRHIMGGGEMVFAPEQRKSVSAPPQIHSQNPTKKVCTRQGIPLQGVSSARGSTRVLEGGACAVPPG